MLAVDLHAHAGFLHVVRGRPTPFDPVSLRVVAALARRRGLDAVAVTNHDFHEPHPDWLGGVRLLPGIEISTTRGHLLVVGPDPPRRTARDALTPEEAVELAHDRGCAAVVAHPFRNSTVAEADAPFDAVELNGKRPNRQGVERLARDLDVPVVGGSDAHFPVEVGRAYTRLDAADPTPAAVVRAIREGRVEACVRESRLDALFHRAYGAVHRLRGHDGPRDH
ncbi:MAG: PHP domain-containing protein [Haloplanus sp.]